MTVEKPSLSEEEYFAREDALKKEKIAREQARLLEQQQRDSLKTMHFMKCPRCGMDLHAIAFRGLEIERCMNCGGHWLDASELEKVVGSEHGTVMAAVLNWFKGH